MLIASMLRLIRGLAFVNSDKYVQTKLVDKLLYRDQIDSVFAAQLKVKKSELKMVNLSVLAAQQTDDIEVKDGVVQVIYAEGEITQANISPFAAGVSTIGAGLSDRLREAAEDDDVKAVVLRMNSPGGDAFLSEQLWHAVKQLRSKKPVVVSMGDYAASGGYISHLLRTALSLSLIRLRVLSVSSDCSLTLANWFRR